MWWMWRLNGLFQETTTSWYEWYEWLCDCPILGDLNVWLIYWKFTENSSVLFIVAFYWIMGLV